MIPRCSAFVVLLLVTSGARVWLTPTDVVSPEPLWKVPEAIDQWRGYDVPLDSETLENSGSDDYLNRYYQSADGVIGLYVAYYRSQRPGHAIHSPMNCMPGAGWQPVSVDRVPLGTEGAAGGDASRTINKVVIEKGGERQLVLYWYQTVGRVTASEYWSKLYLATDAVRSGRTDIALVRVVIPIDGRDPHGEAKGFARALPFAARLFPLLRDQLFQS